MWQPACSKLHAKLHETHYPISKYPRASREKKKNFATFAVNVYDSQRHDGAIDNHAFLDTFKMRGKVIVQVMDWNLNVFIVRTISAAHGKTFFFLVTHLETFAYTLSLFSPLYQRFQKLIFIPSFLPKSNPLTTFPLPVPQYPRIRLQTTAIFILYNLTYLAVSICL